MPNHEVPIADADVWDILDWDVVCGLAAGAPSDPRDDNRQRVVEWFAEQLVNGAAKDPPTDCRLLRKYASAWAGQGDDPVRRRKASVLAGRLGARPDRFIAFLAKFGLF